MDNNIEEKIKKLLDTIRPYLQMDGGNIEYIKYEDKYVYIKLSGACAHCGYQDLTIKDGIEEMLKSEIPEIEGVINVEL
jgi:Fe-S cluster biogenesis protein NfuA